MLSMLLLAILAVGVFTVFMLRRIASTLSQIDRQLTEWQEERSVEPQVVFSRFELDLQRRKVERLYERMEKLVDALESGKADEEVLVPDLLGGVWMTMGQIRQNYDDLQRERQDELRHLDMMFRANARVRRGDALSSEALDQVHADYLDRMDSRHRENEERRRENERLKSEDVSRAVDNGSSEPNDGS